MVQLSHSYMTTGKTIALTIQIFRGTVMSLIFKTLSIFVIVFLPRSKWLLILRLQSLSAVILKSTVSTASPSICHEVMGPDAMILIFWMLSFKLAFSLSCFTFIKMLFNLFNSSSLSARRVPSSVYLRLLIFLPSIPISAYDSFSQAFCMMYSADKLNKQVDNIQT